MFFGVQPLVLRGLIVSANHDITQHGFFWRGARKSSQDDINSTYTCLFFIFQRSQKCIDKIHRWSGGVCFEPLKSYQTMDSPQVLGGLGKCWRSPATDPTDSKQFKLFGDPTGGLFLGTLYVVPFCHLSLVGVSSFKCNLLKVQLLAKGPKFCL